MQFLKIVVVTGRLIYIKENKCLPFLPNKNEPVTTVLLFMDFCCHTKLT